MITGKINVKKIDKSRLYEGEKGTYLDIALIETPDNKYGYDFMIIQQTKKGEDSIILGNAKYLKAKTEIESPADDDLPF